MTTSTQLAHDPETAGSVMATNVPTTVLGSSIGSVQQLLKDQASTFVSVAYVYVLNDARVLVGVVSIKDVLEASEDQLVADSMHEVSVSVRSDVDQEEVARVALHYNVKAVPVVNNRKEFLGAVTADQVLTILHDEHIEDLLLHSGTIVPDTGTATNILAAPARTHILQRIPWLLIGLCGGIVAALVVGQFESVLEQHLAIAAFIPVIVYLADAIGAQIQLIFIRSLALDNNLPVWRYFIREVKVNLVLGLILALSVAGISYLWLGFADLSLVLALSVFATAVAALIIAVALPYALYRLRFDPAIGSGPFATVICDILSLLIYFMIANTLLLV